MYVISVKDVNNILEKYELGNSGKAVAIEILQYYQVDEKICIVILIETILHVRYVMKLLSDKWICVEEEEKRSEFSELLRGNGLPVPQKYKVKNRYIGCFCFGEVEFKVTIEDYFGENLKTVSFGNIKTLGRLLADMHKISINHEYHLKKGSTYCALFSGRVGIDRIWGENKSILLKANLYKKVKAIHEMSINKIKNMWTDLPIYAVHGDLGLLSNVTIYNNQYGIIDFNLSGDEVLLNDMLITWYSSVYSFDIALILSLKERIENRKIFFSSYLNNRNLNTKEQEYLYDMACIINGVYFNRFVALLASKGFKKSVKKMIPHITANYYCLDSDIDIQSELQEELNVLY